MSKLHEEIRAAINRSSAENGSDTPDFILAEYLLGCLAAYDKAVTAREKWYGRERLAGFHPHPFRDSPASLDRDQMGELLLATRQALRDLLPWAKGCTTKNKERTAAVRRAEEVLLPNDKVERRAR
jgi:hypothetical protein